MSSGFKISYLSWLQGKTFYFSFYELLEWSFILRMKTCNIKFVNQVNNIDVMIQV